MESTDSSTGSQQPQLPPGFRFHPTDEELVVHYLKKKAAAAPLPVTIIAEVDLYKFDPWELPGILVHSFLFFVLFFLFSNSGINFVSWFFFQQRLYLGSKSGTFSVQGIGSIRTGRGRIGRRLPVTGRRRGPTSRCWRPAERRKLELKRPWFSMEGSPLKGSKPIGSCMNTDS